MPAHSLTEFTGRVLGVVRRIPAGRVATYGQVAEMAGRPGAARAVGNIMRTATFPGLPYHRVVAAGGRLGGYGGNEMLKRERLIAEGIQFSGTRIRNFKSVTMATSRARGRAGAPGGGSNARARATRDSRRAR